MTITYGSVCSGIDAATVAWHPLGWRARWLSEVEPFPCSLLTYHYPSVPNLGDMTTIADKVPYMDYIPDVLTGGTPCQAFSVAGARRGLADERGNLTLTFVELANALDKRREELGLPSTVIVWENVPGVLSSKDNAFGCFLGGIAGEDMPLEPPGPRPAGGKSNRSWGWSKKEQSHYPKWSNAGAVLGPERAVAWRILDAQYFGVAQRRRRVWVVASARDGFDPCSVLFESEGVRRDSAPSREARQASTGVIAEGIAGTLGANHGNVKAEHAWTGQLQVEVFGGNDTSGPIDVAAALNANRGCHNPGDFEAGNLIACVDVHPALCNGGKSAGSLNQQDAENGAAIVAFPTELSGTQAASAKDRAPALSVKHTMSVAFDTTQCTSPSNYSNPKFGDPCHPLAAGAHPPAIASLTRARHSECHGISSDAIDRSGEGDGTAGQRSGLGISEEISPALRARSNNSCHVGMQVRRPTPTECERLQGFPDNYTADIPSKPVPASGQAKARKRMIDGDPQFTEIDGVIWKANHADGPRYKALGNSWAVPCAAWIGRRIEQELDTP